MDKNQLNELHYLLNVFKDTYLLDVKISVGIDRLRNVISEIKEEEKGKPIPKHEIKAFLNSAGIDKSAEIYSIYAKEKKLKVYDMNYLEEYFKGKSLYEVLNKLNFDFDIDDGFFWEDNFGFINSGNYHKFLFTTIEFDDIVDYVYKHQIKLKKYLTTNN